MPELSPRLLQIVEALPLRPDLRVLEIGCGPGAMARELARRLPQGFVLGIDRSAKAISQAMAADNPPNLAFRQASADSFALAPGEAPFDLAVAIRVGALDGRHPDLEQASRSAIRAALKRDGRLYIDGGSPLREIDLSE